jgi:purine-binding chemotaxis protein CheW
MARKKKSAGAKISSVDALAPAAVEEMPSPEMVDLNAYLEEIGSRLITGPDQANLAAQTATPAPEHRQLIVFRMGALKYGIEISHVTETVRRPEITHVPGVPGWVMGVCNAHGEIISAVDLASFLELTTRVQQDVEYMLITHAEDQRIGLIVDEVEVIYTLPAEEIVSPLFKVEPNLVNFLQGAVERGDGFVRLLDCDRLLLGTQMQQFR